MFFFVLSGLLIVYLTIKIPPPPNFQSFNKMFMTYTKAENFYKFSWSYSWYNARLALSCTHRLILGQKHGRITLQKASSYMWKTYMSEWEESYSTDVEEFSESRGMTVMETKSWESNRIRMSPKQTMLTLRCYFMKYQKELSLPRI